MNARLLLGLLALGLAAWSIQGTLAQPLPVATGVASVPTANIAPVSAVYVDPATRVSARFANLAVSRLYWTGYCWGWWGWNGGWGGNSGCCCGCGGNGWGGYPWRYGCYYPYYLTATAAASLNSAASAFSLAPTSAPPAAPAGMK